MSDIIIFPEYEETKTAVEKLRTELSMLMLEYDELRFVECKNIEMAYMLELGSYEYKAFEAQCAFLRLRRKVEMLQAKKNRQEPIVLSMIEEALDKEFEEFQEKLNEQLGKMNDAIDRSKGEFLSEEDTKELKKLYRRIIKALHPDLHPDETTEQINLFEKAVEAYETGDLGTLRIIDVMVSDPAIPAEHEDALTELTRERQRLSALVESVKTKITEIKSQYPYNVKSIVNDKEKIKERRDELLEITSQYEAGIEIYKARINEMLEGYAHG